MTFDVKKLVGMTYEGAKSVAAKEGLRPRLCRQDDNSYSVTMDMRDDRVNFEVDAGRITKAYLG